MPKTIIITGASDGIGAAAARQLAEDGHRLILVGRSTQKTAAVARELSAEYFVADYARLDDVRELAGEIRRTTDHVDVLANNAGGIFGRRELTVDGHEKTFQVNHLAPFLLTDLLLDLLGAGDGVVVNTSSSGAKLLAKFDIDDLEGERAYSPNTAYGNAKLANILHARGLVARHGGDGIHAVAFDPGNVRTGFAGDTTSLVRFIYRTPIGRLFLISPEKGGSHLTFFVRGDPGVDWEPGRFYTRTRLATQRATHPAVHDDALVGRLWERSAALLGLTPS